MKRIALFFAAIAALSSCMKENTLAPTRPADGQVTIKAVAADTKTLLDGTAVVWEDNDVVKLVLDLDGYENDLVEDFTIANADGNEAEFTGEFGVGAMDVPAGLSAYAVYPASAVSVDNSTGKVEISHNLPAVQDGTITSGMNLSSAAVAVAGLRTGYAEAQFHNALTLLNVVVPAGVKSVALTAQTGLAGDADFTPDSKDHSENVDDPDNPGQVIEQVTPASGKLTTTGGSSATVTLSQGGEDLEGTHTLLVYPAAWGSLTLTMTGLDDAEYTNSLSTALEASKSYTIDLTKVFKMEYEEVKAVSPVGDTFEVTVVATEDYTYNVNTNGADWVSLVETKAFGGKTLVFSVEANEGEAREATVTITWGEDNERTFKVTQQGIFMDIIGDQWEETFSVYASESDALAGTGAKATYKNVFEIALSDDFSKGVYKITGMFMTDSYYDNNGQPVASKGGEYYADYKDGILTVHMASAVKSYGFTSDVTLTYDPSAKTFAASAPLSVFVYTAGTYMNKSGYIGGYSVAEKTVEDSGEDATGFEVLYGTYDESANLMGWGNPETLVISESDNSSYDIKMLFGYTEGDSSYSYDTAYGKVSGDGTSVTVTIPGGTSSFFGPVSDFTLTIDGNVISGSYAGMMSYTATKRVAFDVTTLYGTYDESANLMGWGNPETLVISESDNSSYDIKMLFGYTEGDSSYSYDTAYGKVSGDGTSVTVTIPGGTSSFFGPVSDFTLTIDGNVISGSYAGMMSYTATKK